jgi:hypothetical protein
LEPTTKTEATIRNTGSKKRRNRFKTAILLERTSELRQ